MLPIYMYLLCSPNTTNRETNLHIDASQMLQCQFTKSDEIEWSEASLTFGP